MRGISILSIGIGIALCLLAFGPAQAQLLFSLNPAGLTGTPGGSVTFNATLTNSGNDTVWLNGDSSGVSASGLTIDDTPYVNNFPLFLIGGDAATADLFTVNIDPLVAPGNYFGSFTIVGGADGFAQDALATQNFEVTVQAPVPEPGNLVLLLGLALPTSIVTARRLSNKSKRRDCCRPSLMLLLLFWCGLVGLHQAGAQSNELFVSSYLNSSVKLYDGNSGASLGDFVTHDTGGLAGSHGLVFGSNGDLFVNSYWENAIKRFDGATGAFLYNFVPAGYGGLLHPHGLALGPDGDLYVTNQDLSSVKRYNGLTGVYMGDFVQASAGGLANATGLAFGPDGNLYVSSFATGAIKRYSGENGAYLGDFVPGGAGGLANPYGLVFGSDGNLYVSDGGRSQILKYNGKTGAFLSIFATQSETGLSGPGGLAFGPDGNLYVTNLNSATIIRLDGKTGALIDDFVPSGLGGLSVPTYLTFRSLYQIVNLGTLGGYPSSYATSINNAGQVVGYSSDVTGDFDRAFLWQNGVMTDLKTLGNDPYSYASAINDVSQVVGYSYDATGNYAAFLWQKGVMNGLPSLPGGFGVTSGINDKGQAVGLSFTGQTQTVFGDTFNLYHAVLWQNSRLTDLGTLGGTISEALSINNAGQIVGTSTLSVTYISTSHACLWQNGSLTDLGTLGSNFSTATSINNMGQIVGFSYLADDHSYHAVLWQNGMMIDLGTLGGVASEPSAINDHGQVVGNSYLSDNQTEHAVLWQNGVITDLNNLIPPNSGWVLISANAINNAGQVVGQGTYQGQLRAFLLTPNDNGVQASPVLITNVTASNLSLNGATISWNTNVAANSTVEFGYTDSYGQTSSVPALVTNHSITLNLLPDRIYHYRVTSTAANGQTATSADQTFVTMAGPDFYMSYANLRKDPYGRYLIDLTFTNQGGANIPEIKVYGATLGSATPLSPNLPLPKFGLTTNASHTVTVTFPGTAGSSGASVPLEVGTALYDAFGNLLGYVGFNYRGVLLP